MAGSPVETRGKALDVTFSCSRHFVSWLHDRNVTLAVSTYQTNRLFLLGLKPDGKLAAFERLFERAMGVCPTSTGFYLATRYQIWRFENCLAEGQLHNGHDAVFVPRTAHTTGDLDAHDLAVDRGGRLLFVNTLYSCLATVSGQHSFEPIWKPPFVSRLAPEDRCHLNGLALRDGEPRYLTAISRSDVPAGWRKRRGDGGCALDMMSDAPIATSLSMPHSPRFWQDRLWLLNSGTGEFGFVDLDNGSFQAICFCPGYLRGLAFTGGYAIVGLSRPRENRLFTDLALDSNLARRDAQSICGLMVINIQNGNIEHWCEFEGVVTELYDVQVLPGFRRSMLLGFRTDEIRRLISFVDGKEVLLHAQPREEAPAPQ
jgi:uncharacterized protein (TIGR03032 family)